ncbi:uncharacterized protein ACA1_306830 [Acanthamoeba castellanii str. Neff]|uniref:Uncharacterized protein n=1 Tax=Acanthamoeba castellanii (strain ATCC 30010 / Neff) TaxID=1257118 RepID=L8GPM9_ACACF|nr:uncharacterized protein ACA1_306830 [Acanthamoeba castellanii str. Neff]ELR14887.1 hypothetical protein ACA1_306830 [Acanthamoeba castellanii str. Neff]
MKRRASIPDEQLALEGLVSLSGHHTASSSAATTAHHGAHLLKHQSHLPWNVMMGNDDKPASENNKHQQRPSLVQLASCPGSSSSSTSSSVPPSESKMQRGSRPHFSAKDALKDALAAEHSATTHYTASIHPPSSFFSTTSSSTTSMPTSPLSCLSSPRSSFSLPPLSSTLASLHSTSTSTTPSPRSSFSSSTPASSSRRSSISSSVEPPAKRVKLEYPEPATSSSSSSATSSPMSSPRRGSFSAATTMVAAGVPMMDDPPEDAQLIPVTARNPHGGEVCIHIEKPVLEALTASGISPESIVDLIVQNDKESRDQVIRETGFSTNYIMKLQRRVLHSSSQLQLPPPVRHSFATGVDLHVLFDSDGGPLFMKKELCTILGMKGTTFSYWKKKSNVEDTDTSKDFRLMDICRTLFGGRATYTLYSPASTLTILNEMETSRQKNSFSNLAALKFLVTTYGHPASASASTSSSTSTTPTPPTATATAVTIGSLLLEGTSAAADAVSAAHPAAC